MINPSSIEQHRLAVDATVLFADLKTNLLLFLGVDRTPFLVCRSREHASLLQLVEPSSAQATHASHLGNADDSFRFFTHLHTFWTDLAQESDTLFVQFSQRWSLCPNEIIRDRHEVQVANIQRVEFWVADRLDNDEGQVDGPDYACVAEERKCLV